MKLQQLPVSLLYGSGLRIMELLRLRVQDIDFQFQQVRVFCGKGNKNRFTTLAPELFDPLHVQIEKVEKYLAQDVRNEEFSGVWLPYALADKYNGASKELAWQYLFPSARLSVDPLTQCVRRHHFDESTVNKAIKRAAKQAGITKMVSAHTLRHSFAAHLLQSGADIRTVQQQLGYVSVQTTEIYTHIIKQGGQGVKSPLSALLS